MDLLPVLALVLLLGAPMLVLLLVEEQRHRRRLEERVLFLERDWRERWSYHDA